MASRLWASKAASYLKISTFNKGFASGIGSNILCWVVLTRRTSSYHSYSQSRPYDCIDEDPLVVQQKAILIALMKEPWKLSQLLKMKKKLANHSLSIEFFVGKPLKIGPDVFTEEKMGVNYRAINDFLGIQQERKDMITYTLFVQPLEIYNELIRDLLFADRVSKKYPFYYS
ncbi:hypothetical protein L1887_31263 [Cichorium endivia]|nr:hypothetical protein L1887_31263 [Cichorium endivia]